MRLLLLIACCSYGAAYIHQPSPFRSSSGRRTLSSTAPRCANGVTPWTNCSPMMSVHGRSEPRERAPPSTTLVLGSCLTLSVVSGSFYTWSLMLPALQLKLGCDRAPLSAVFSLATICFTCGTSFLAPRLLSRLSPSAVMLAVGGISACGLTLASFFGLAGRFAMVVLALGWGVAFGSMSGLAYAQNAKISTSSLFAGRDGFATGLRALSRKRSNPGPGPWQVSHPLPSRRDAAALDSRTSSCRRQSCGARSGDAAGAMGTQSGWRGARPARPRGLRGCGTAARSFRSSQTRPQQQRV